MTWVYFMREVNDGPVKIGWSVDPWKRLETLQAGNPRELVLLTLKKFGTDAWATEAALHQEFAAHQIRGEWFNPTPEILARAASFGRPDCERCGVPGCQLYPSKQSDGRVEYVCFFCDEEVRAA